MHNHASCIFLSKSFMVHFQLFEEPLKSRNIIPDSSIAAIFSNIRQIISVNDELLKHLQVFIMILLIPRKCLCATCFLAGASGWTSFSPNRTVSQVIFNVRK